MEQGNIMDVLEKVMYRLMQKRPAEKMIRQDVKNTLIMLHPGQDIRKVCRLYYAKKLAQCALVLLAGGLLIGIMAFVHSRDNILQEGNRLIRGDYQTESSPVELVITGEDQSSRSLTYELLGRTYSEEALEQMAEALKESLPEAILGDNTDPNAVVTPLVMTSSMEGYPFSIEWESSNYALLDDDGTLHNEELKEKETVEVTCRLKYRSFLSEISFPVVVAPAPVREEESLEKQMISLIRREDLQQQESEQLILPGRLLGEAVTYKTKGQGQEWMYLPLLLALAIGLFFLRDRDLLGQLQKKREKLELSYPDFVEKFVLLTGAGLSGRGCLERIGRDANISLELRQELLILLRDLGNGMLESQALDRFGRRCKSPLYIKFSGLLIQNRKKGGPELLRLLEEECEQAFVLRKNQAKKLGEEASTKLLLPMIMMLGVVMAVIIMPAFLSF